MYSKTIKRIYKKIDNLSIEYNNFSNAIYKPKKSLKEFEHATKIGLKLFRQTIASVHKLKKTLNTIECTTLQQAEVNELSYLYKNFEKISYKLNKPEKKHVLFKKFYEEKQNTFFIERNNLFILLVDFISRNFINITLPQSFDVDKYENDSRKISLLNMLNTTDWSKYFSDENMRVNLVSFSKLVFSSTWWNHAKYYRNIFVHRISLDTFYSLDYANLNIRVKTYLPILCFLCIKYFLYNLVNDTSQIHITKNNKSHSFLSKIHLNKEKNYEQEDSSLDLNIGNENSSELESSNAKEENEKSYFDFESENNDNEEIEDDDEEE